MGSKKGQPRAPYAVPQRNWLSRTPLYPGTISKVQSQQNAATSCAKICFQAQEEQVTQEKCTEDSDFLAKQEPKAQMVHGGAWD